MFSCNLHRKESGKSKVTRRKKRKERDSETEEDTDSDKEEEEDSKKATKLVHMLISLFISIHAYSVNMFSWRVFTCFSSIYAGKNRGNQIAQGGRSKKKRQSQIQKKRQRQIQKKRQRQIQKKRKIQVQKKRKIQMQKMVG